MTIHQEKRAPRKKGGGGRGSCAWQAKTDNGSALSTETSEEGRIFKQGCKPSHEDQPLLSYWVLLLRWKPTISFLSQLPLQHGHTPNCYFQSQYSDMCMRFLRDMGGKGAGPSALPYKKVYLASHDAIQTCFSSSTSIRAGRGHLFSSETSQEGWGLC